jgi:hypothetical protein
MRFVRYYRTPGATRGASCTSTSVGERAASPYMVLLRDEYPPCSDGLALP